MSVWFRWATGHFLGFLGVLCSFPVVSDSWDDALGWFRLVSVGFRFFDLSVLVMSVWFCWVTGHFLGVFSVPND